MGRSPLARTRGGSRARAAPGAMRSLPRISFNHDRRTALDGTVTGRSRKEMPMAVHESVASVPREADWPELMESHEGRLVLDGCDLEALARRFGTPCWV